MQLLRWVQHVDQVGVGAAYAVMYALGGSPSSSPGCENLVKLLLDTADALLECLVAAADGASPAWPAASGSPRNSDPVPSCGDDMAGSLPAPSQAQTAQASAIQRSGIGLGLGLARRSLVLALRVLGRALAAPGAAPRDAITHARAFVKERFGMLGELVGWPAQRAALQVH